MTDDDRNKLYWSLLRGIAKECQNRLCEADEQHDWGMAVATGHWPDVPSIPVSAGQAICEMKVHRSFRRECANCGKVQRWT